MPLQCMNQKGRNPLSTGEATQRERDKPTQREDKIAKRLAQLQQGWHRHDIIKKVEQIDGKYWPVVRTQLNHYAKKEKEFIFLRELLYLRMKYEKMENTKKPTGNLLRTRVFTGRSFWREKYWRR